MPTAPRVKIQNSMVVHKTTIKVFASRYRDCISSDTGGAKCTVYKLEVEAKVRNRNAVALSSNRGIWDSFSKA
jgi:hypothetical protein